MTASTPLRSYIANRSLDIIAVFAEQSHLTGKDFVCKNLANKQTVAYFRAVMTPQAKEGKFEISDEVRFLADHTLSF